MELEGVVRNVIDFGVFVDIGVHQDGLVHISQIADGFIRHPSEVLSVNQKVRVKVLDVDLVKNKISLTMKTSETPAGLKVKTERPKTRNNGERTPFDKNRNNNDRGGKGNYNASRNRDKKEESLEEAVRRLQEKFRLG